MTESDVKTALLHRKFAEHMDTETADALIERLPPDWEQLATKTDVARLEARMGALESTVKATVESLEAKLDARVGALDAKLDARVGALESTVKARMGALESTVATGAESLEAKLKAMEGRLNRRAASDLKAMMFGFAGFALAVVGLLVTVLVSGIPAAG